MNNTFSHFILVIEILSYIVMFSKNKNNFGQNFTGGQQFPARSSYPLTPSLTLTLPCVLRYHAEHATKSGSSAASPTAKTKTNEGQLFHQKKREKADLLLFLRERNQRIRNRIIQTNFWFFYCFMYTCFSTVVISQDIKFITDKNKF